MKKYNERLADTLLSQTLAALGGVVLEGARGVGKTTTAKHYAKSYLSLDESPQTVDEAKVFPRNILMGEAPRAIDEWQLAPEVWNAMRNEIDERQMPGQFILTGSATPSDGITRHSGAGRFGRIKMRPMSLYETGQSLGSVSFAGLFADVAQVSGHGGLSVEEYAEALVRGGMPGTLKNTANQARIYYREYLDNIVRVELGLQGMPSNPVRMRALINSVARNTATEASMETLSKEAMIYDTEVSTKTVRKYLDRLSNIFVLDELKAWRMHIRSSVQTRSKPRWHFVDPALSCAALNISSSALLDDLNAFGLFFESMALRDIRSYADVVDGEAYYYRDSSGMEVDIIVQLATGEWIACEVKLGGMQHIESAEKTLLAFAKKISPEARRDMRSLNIITAGEASYTRPSGVNIIALGHLRA
jgi:predicted AAA+ superfamily ATPase